jgi:ribonuclease P protein component
MEKNNIFCKPIRLRESSFLRKYNYLKCSRIIIIIPKYIIKHSNKRNNLKRIIKNFIFNSNLCRFNLDIIFIMHKKPNNKNNILYIINKIWTKLF